MRNQWLFLHVTQHGIPYCRPMRRHRIWGVKFASFNTSGRC